MRTLRVGSAVFKINTAHSISVLGGFSAGTMLSGAAGVRLEVERERCERSGGGGGGLAFEAPGVKVVASAQNAMRRLTYRIIFTMTHSGNKAQTRTLSTSH